MLRWLVLLCGFCATCAAAAPCANEDFQHQVTGADQCLVLASYGVTDAPQVLLVWLHGDTPARDEAVYLFPMARAVAEQFAAQKVLSVALVRPGYADDKGHRSDGDNHWHQDLYTRQNMQIVGGAIDRLKQHYHPQRVILIGHSGGAATAALLAGMMPGLADADILVSCPCDLAAWPLGHDWRASENPMRWADQVQPPLKVFALTGTADDNTGAALAQAYVARLQQHGVDARFIPIPNASHNSAIRSLQVMQTLTALLTAP
ncbi:pimeloyl-ACP methyl ester carboxylesterase [Silvimonas terrae]|uniref:Pimeloyl-ACP methyl ester carboxylesterase n=1 Tax=Silvimonas terrae TaxID=300266 RepID=A0A840RIE9_9NEIS|nr:hypothetical protein [Silvimonas terrae]MBB5192220.1 pimeloyl-ACP methyl ester carboxylesterase [Silvimonas terrae]